MKKKTIREEMKEKLPYEEYLKWLFTKGSKPIKK